MKTKLLLTFFIASFSMQSMATSVSAKVEYLLPHSGNVVFFNLLGHSKDGINALGTNGNCIKSGTGHFRVDLTNETGRAILKTLLTALALDKPITVNGTNTCTSNRENVSWILLRR